MGTSLSPRGWRRTIELGSLLLLHYPRRIFCRPHHHGRFDLLRRFRPPCSPAVCRRPLLFLRAASSVKCRAAFAAQYSQILPTAPTIILASSEFRPQKEQSTRDVLCAF